MSINNIDPIQPYFVLNTKLYRKQMLTSSPVAHFYQFSYTEQNPVINGVVPDGTIDVIFDTGNCCAAISGSVESVTESYFVPEHTYFGMRFRPGAFEHYGEIAASELIGASVPLSELFKSSELDAVFACGTFEQRVNAADKLFRGIYSQKEEQTYVLAKGMLSYIYDHNGAVLIGDMEDEFHYSRRNLLRVFKRYLGMDIKTFCRIVRFQSVLSRLNASSCLPLSELAQEYGYYDQNHFQKEFKEFALLTPKVYIRTIQENAYRNRIKCL